MDPLTVLTLNIVYTCPHINCNLGFLCSSAADYELYVMVTYDRRDYDCLRSEPESSLACSLFIEH